MRALAIVIALCALSLAGCLRSKYDLCEREPPHPECDAGRPSDAGGDGGEADAAAEDAATAMDSGVDGAPGEDAGEPDAGADGSPAEDDAGADAAALVDAA